MVLTSKNGACTFDRRIFKRKLHDGHDGREKETVCCTAENDISY